MCNPENDERLEEVKVNKWDGAAVRNALDDEIRCILTHDYKYSEDHKLTDGRLLISVLAVADAGLALIWDWFHPFPASQNVLTACIITYFVLMGLLTLYTQFYERGIFVVAKKKDEVGLEPAKVFTVASNLDRFNDMYGIEIWMNIEGKRGVKAEAKLEKSIASWFDHTGVLRKDLIRKDVDRLHNQLLDGKKSH